MTAPTSSDACLEGLRILIVEDVGLLADELRNLVEELGGEVVDTASTVDQGLRASRSASLDGALLDVHLHGEESFPIADVLESRGVPFIFLTGYAGDSLGARSGHEFVLEKPFDADELIGVMKQAFGRGLAGGRASGSR